MPVKIVVAMLPIDTGIAGVETVQVGPANTVLVFETLTPQF